MFFITTFNYKIYNLYANNFINTYIKTNQQIPLICYVEEDFEYPKHKNITYIKLQDKMPQIIDFKKRHPDKIIEIEDEKDDSTQFLQNAIKFSHKVFAQTHASYKNEKFIFMDADNIFKKEINEHFFNSFIPNESFLTFYGRPNWVEAGIIGFNSKIKDISKTFFKIYLDFYLQDKIFEMKFKTDCQALDATRKIMKKNPYYKETNRGDGLDGHVIFRDKEISIYIDHRKGRRKFEKIENKRNQIDHNIKHKVNIFKKVKVNIKNFIFKKLQK